MKKTTSIKLTPHRLWIGLFAIWLVLISGVFSIRSIGSSKKLASTAPGVWQYHQLKLLRDGRKKSLTELQAQMKTLEDEIEALETSPVAQERAIRTHLGYARPDELLFEIK